MSTTDRPRGTGQIITIESFPVIVGGDVRCTWNGTYSKFASNQLSFGYTVNGGPQIHLYTSTSSLGSGQVSVPAFEAGAAVRFYLYDHHSGDTFWEDNPLHCTVTNLINGGKRVEFADSGSGDQYPPNVAPPGMPGGHPTNLVVDLSYVCGSVA